MVKNKEANILIVSNVLREIITIFSGPFLTAYFFKISKNSLIDLSVYNILVFLCVGFFGLILGYIIKLDFFKGMSVADGALKILITLLIINAFKTDLNLGIFSSVSSLLTIIFQYVYTKYYKIRNDKNMIIICAIIPVVSLILLLILNNNIALCLYYFCYSSLVGVLNFIIDIRLFNLSNIPLIKNDNQMEFWSLREIVLNSGRIISYILLLMVSIIDSGKYLNILMLFLTFSIMLMGIFLSKMSKNDK